jgi:hypothetical protein
VSAQLRQFLDDEMRPYLEQAGAHAMPWVRCAAQKMFQQFRVLLPPNSIRTWMTWKTFAKKSGNWINKAACTRFCMAGCCAHPLSYALLLLRGACGSGLEVLTFEI